MSMCVYVFVRMCVCVCMCVCKSFKVIFTQLLITPPLPWRKQTFTPEIFHNVCECLCLCECCVCWCVWENLCINVCVCLNVFACVSVLVCVWESVYTFVCVFEWVCVFARLNVCEFVFVFKMQSASKMLILFSYGGPMLMAMNTWVTCLFAH